MKQNHKVIIVVVMLPVSVLVILLSFGTTPCSDLVLSPQELLRSNEYVYLAQFEKVDIVSTLGPARFVGDSFQFAVFEYSFRVIQSLKGKDNERELYLWSCEFFKHNSRSETKFDMGAGTLVYGNEIRDAKEAVMTLAPISSAEMLKAFVMRLPIDSNLIFRSVDTVVARRILGDSTLGAKLADQKRRGKVLYTTDFDLRTLWTFDKGALCYEDDGFQSVTNTEYFDRLIKLAHSK